MVMSGIESLGLTDREFKLGDTTFRIEKLLPEPAFDLAEIIRSNAVNLWGKQGTGQMTLADLIAALMALDPTVVKQIQRIIYNEATFANPRTQMQFMTLPGKEGMAFGALEIIHHYEVLIRGLAINFMPSWDALSSRIPSQVRDSVLQAIVT